MVILVLVLAAAVLALAFQLARWRAELLRLARQLTDLPENSNQELHCSVRAKPFLALCSALEDHLWAARQSAADARRAQRELQYAIAAVSHDIRTPLTGAAGYLQLAQACPDPKKRGEYLGVVRGRLHDLEGLLDELFLYTRLAGGELPLSCGSRPRPRRCGGCCAIWFPTPCSTAAAICPSPRPAAAWFSQTVCRTPPPCGPNICSTAFTAPTTPARAPGPGWAWRLCGS